MIGPVPAGFRRHGHPGLQLVTCSLFLSRVFFFFFREFSFSCFLFPGYFLYLRDIMTGPGFLLYRGATTNSSLVNGIGMRNGVGWMISSSVRELCQLAKRSALLCANRRWERGPLAGEHFFATRIYLFLKFWG